MADEQQAAFDELIKNTGMISPLAAKELKEAKALFDSADPNNPDDVRWALARAQMQSYAGDMAEAAKAAFKAPDNSLANGYPNSVILGKIGGFGLLRDLEFAPDKVEADFKQIAIRGLTGESPSSPEIAGETPYEKTLRQLNAISPEAAKTYQAGAELAREGNDPATVQARARLRELFGGQINDAVVKAAESGNKAVLDAAHDFMGENLSRAVWGDSVDTLVKNPTDPNALYKMAQGARKIAFDNPDTIAPTVTTAREMDGTNQGFRNMLDGIDKVSPNAARTLLALADLNHEDPNAPHSSAGPGNNRALIDAMNWDMDAFVKQMQSAEQTSEGKQAVLAFVKSQGLEGDSADAIAHAAMKAVAAGISGGDAQTEPPPPNLPRAPGGPISLFPPH